MSSSASQHGDRAGFDHLYPAIGRVLAGTLQLREVIEPLAATVRAVLPFDRMGLSLLRENGRVHVLSTGGDVSGDVRQDERLRSDYSPVLWPVEGDVLVSDASGQLDARCVVDGSKLADGVMAIAAVTIETGGRPLGLLWFDSREPGAFDAADVKALRPLADLLVLAVEHDRLWTIERDRRLRHEKLELLLPAIAEALDIREVFPRLSALIQDVIPHVTVALALLTPDRRGVKIHVASNYDVGDLPVYPFTAEAETIAASWRSFIAYDVTVLEDGIRAQVTPPGAGEPVYVELRPGPPWPDYARRMGVRSLLRVPIRVKERPVGAISFGSDRVAAYSNADVELAARIADHLALALAHEQLAEEAHRAAQAREREARLQLRVDTLVQEIESRGPHRALGGSSRWKQALEHAAKVAETDTTVLITGESGTGKEVVARCIHRGSPRAHGPFVALNCAALPEQLLESELFGYERGAFTGAHVARAGKIEQAAGGVLFLDEVGEMPPPVQAKFLRVLQEREFQRLGGTKVLKADVRVIAATNRDPRLAMERGTLREDLYYRLAVFEIVLPPLRERPDDILLLAEAFLKEIAGSIGRPAAGLSEDARDRLLAHTWPGNVRELRNAIERAVILCEGGLITSEHLPIAVARVDRGTASRAGLQASASFPPEGVTLLAVERDLLEKALATARNNKSRAAKLLGLPRGQFYSLLKRHGLTETRR
jgi:transcriptional regulator with GAF, ATPase, and Fis domain